MKLRFMSDLHLEWRHLEAPALAGEDVLVLAGDIGNGCQGPMWANDYMSPGTRPIIFLPGNHEYYGMGHFDECRALMREYCVKHLIVPLINDGDHFLYNRTLFIGGTFWTDFKWYFDKSAAMNIAREGMNDFVHINGGFFQPEDYEFYHYKTLAGMQELLLRHSGKYDKLVVCTHHAPSERSCLPRYINDPMTAAYVSDMRWWIEKHRPNAWIHGHVHNSNDYRIGDCQVLANPRGYASSKRVENERFDPTIVVEI